MKCPICGTTHVPTEDDKKCTVVAEEMARIEFELEKAKQEATILRNILSHCGVTKFQADDCIAAVRKEAESEKG